MGAYFEPEKKNKYLILLSLIPVILTVSVLYYCAYNRQSTELIEIGHCDITIVNRYFSITDSVSLNNVKCVNQHDIVKSIDLSNTRDDYYMLLDNDNNQLIYDQLEKMFQLFDDWIKRGYIIYVGSKNPESVASSFIISYYMTRFNSSFEDEYLYYQSIYPYVNLNDGFQQQLRLWEIRDEISTVNKDTFDNILHQAWNITNEGIHC